MLFPFYKYEGCGNDFILFHNPKNELPPHSAAIYEKLCHRRFGIGADGIIVLEPHASLDFSMKYYNADGNLGSFCGNGGRCAVRFADFLGLTSNENTAFMAADGTHTAHISPKKIRLAMADVTDVTKIDEHNFFVHTGSPHHIILTQNLAQIDILPQAKAIRYNAQHAPLGGTNVNFLEQAQNQNHLRTYERGVEDETYACGTGATAAAVVLAFRAQRLGSSQHHFLVKGGELSVSLEQPTLGRFQNIFLEGDATFVYQGSVNL